MQVYNDCINTDESLLSQSETRTISSALAPAGFYLTKGRKRV